MTGGSGPITAFFLRRLFRYLSDAELPAWFWVWVPLVVVVAGFLSADWYGTGNTGIGTVAVAAAVGMSAGATGIVRISTSAHRRIRARQGERHEDGPEASA